MSGDVFETSKVVLTCTVVRGQSSSNKAKFSVLRDGTEFSSKEVALEGDQAKYEIDKLPEVKPTEDKWVLTYKVTCDGTDYNGSEVHNVWPLKMKLKAVKEADNSAFPLALFAVTQSGDTTTCRAGTDGTATHWLRFPAAFSVDVGPQFRIVKWNKQTGRDWEAVVDDRVDADFEAPAQATDKKQYVNLPTTTDGQDHNASLVKFTVFAKDPGGGGKGGKAGNKIFIEVEYGTKDPITGGAWAHARNLPKRKLTGVEGLRDVDGGKKQTGFVKLAADAGTASFQVELGLAGGDTCTVKIGGTPACDGPKRELENWRRLYYEIVAPDFMTLADKNVSGRACKDLPAATVAQIKTRADAAFFEYVLFDSHIFTEGDAPAGTVKTGAWGGKGGTPKLYVLSDHTFKEYPAAVDKTRPRTMILKLCDQNWYFDPGVAAPTVTSHTFDAASLTIDVAPGGAFSSISGADGSPAMKSARWKAAFPDKRAWMKKPTKEWASTTPKTGGAVDGTVVVRETLQNSELTLVFKKKVLTTSRTTLQRGDFAKLQPWMDGLMASVSTLRAKGNKLKFEIVCTGSGRGKARFDVVKGWVDQAFTASPNNKKIPTHPGINDAGHVRGKTLTLGTDYRVEEVEASKFKVTLLGDGARLAGALSPTKVPLKVTLTYEVLDSGLGLSGQGAQLGENLVVYESASPGCTTDTLLHELGHSMGLVYFSGRGKALPPGMAFPAPVPGGTAYDETHGGSGTHCAFGVGNKAAASYQGGNKGTCLMLDWGPSTDPSIATSGFCATCRNYVRGVDLSSL